MQVQALDASTPPPPAGLGGAGVAAGSSNVAGGAVVATDTNPKQTPTNASAQQVQDAVAKANTSLQSIPTSLQFQIDPASKQVVVQLVDTADNTVLRQVPTAEVLEIAKSIDQMQGLLIKQVA
jgi:flagellar protein FlaG